MSTNSLLVLASKRVGTRRLRYCFSSGPLRCFDMQNGSTFVLPTAAHLDIVNGEKQRRHQSGLSSLTNYVNDVFRTRSLNPSNPILASVSMDETKGSDSGETQEVVTKELPDFSRILPYHLESAVQDVKGQYRVDLAELEVSLTGVHGAETKANILQKLDQVEAPVFQILQVGKLYCELASPPDKLTQWQTAYSRAQQIFSSSSSSSSSKVLPWRQSKVIYENLPADAPPDLKLAFEQRGAHVKNDDEARNELRDLQEEIQSIRQRLQRSTSYSGDPQQLTTSKALKLQLVSDLYNCIGLSQLQAQKLGYPNVTAMTANQRMATSKEVLELIPQVATFLKPHLPSLKLNIGEASGAFLGSNDDELSEFQKDVLKAKFFAKKALYMHGVLQGIADFSDTVLGVRMQPERVGGWNKNVRLLHLYDSDTDEHLGCIYLDPFQDSYWRSESAQEKVFSSLFSVSKSQTPVPVAIVALKIAPTWDDAPSPASWDDTRDMLYQMGKAIQLVLSQAKVKSGRSVPKDSSEFLASFMEMWVHNDGFLQRLAQLSQDKVLLELETMEVLREDLKREKAMDIMRSAFLGSLELSIFCEFDPRGDETLGALQSRLAEKYLPHEGLDSSDLSPLLELFDTNDDEAPYSPLWSELLAATVYETFTKIDLKDRDEVHRFGRGVRDLFLRDTLVTKQDVEELCGSPVTAESLQRVHGF